MGLFQRSRWQWLAAPGNQDAASRTRIQSGRADSREASERDRRAPRRVRADRAKAPLVRLVRRVHRRPRTRQDFPGGGPRRSERDKSKRKSLNFEATKRDLPATLDPGWRGHHAPFFNSRVDRDRRPFARRLLGG